MKKSLLFFFISLPLLALTACNTPSDGKGDLWEEINVDTPAHSTTSASTNPKEEIEEEKEPVESILDEGNLSFSSYYQNSDVSYYTPSKKLEGPVFKKEKIQQVFESYTEASGHKGDEPSHLNTFSEWYEIGIIQKAPYKGWSLVLLDIGCEGMCFSGGGTYRFAHNQDSGEVVYLPKYSSSNEFSDKWLGAFIENINNDFELKSLNLPETINLPETKASISLITKDSSYGFDVSEREIVFETEEMGKFYGSDKLGCVSYLHPDGSWSVYTYEADLESELTWKDGTKTDLGENYALDPGGCGLSHGCYIIYSVEKSELEEVGQTASGFKFYQAKKTKEMSEDELYTEGVEVDANLLINRRYKVQKSMAEYSEEKEALNFEEFLAERPIIFWEDPFGRISMLINSEFRPMAECGKPVIYLYPEQAQDVSVEVHNIEFTKTIPEYNNGWNVRAQPDGTLYNYADGKEYSDLFWEGNSEVQNPINSGFSIPRNEVEPFLYESLTKLGLNKNEQADFMEFWLTRMLENKEPYFFINFTGTRDFNRVAPLSITPEPDTLIRVFMYYEPTFERWDLPEQKLSTIPREGFTVIEWGGTAAWPWNPEVESL